MTEETKIKNQTIFYTTLTIIVILIVLFIVFNGKRNPANVPAKTGTPHEVIPVYPCHDGKCA